MATSPSGEIWRNYITGQRANTRVYLGWCRIPSERPGNLPRWVRVVHDGAMFIKRVMFLGLSAALTAIVALVVRRLAAFAYMRATGQSPPAD